MGFAGRRTRFLAWEVGCPFRCPLGGTNFPWLHEAHSDPVSTPHSISTSPRSSPRPRASLPPEHPSTAPPPIHPQRCLSIYYKTLKSSVYMSVASRNHFSFIPENAV